MGTIVGISDLDPLRWPGSKWRSLQVKCIGTNVGYFKNSQFGKFGKFCFHICLLNFTSVQTTGRVG